MLSKVVTDSWFEFLIEGDKAVPNMILPLSHRNEGYDLALNEEELLCLLNRLRLAVSQQGENSDARP